MSTDPIVEQITNEFDEAEAAFRADIEDDTIDRLFAKLMTKIKNRELTHEQMEVVYDRLQKATRMFAQRRELLAAEYGEQVEAQHKIKQYIRTSYLNK